MSEHALDDQATTDLIPGNEPVEIPDVDVEDIEDPHTFVWGEEFFYCGPLADGRHVVVHQCPAGGWTWALPSADSALQYMTDQLVDLMHVGEEPEGYTLYWPQRQVSLSEQHFVGTRSNDEHFYSVLRIGDRREVEEHDDALAALGAALDAAEELVEHVAGDDDAEDKILEALLMSQIQAARSWLWHSIARDRVNTAEEDRVFGYGAADSKDLATRLSMDEAVVAEILGSP
jgi:hypothetical protein